MHLYDSLIIGAGYSSLGYALKNGNSIIIEENQCADPNFYLSLKNFSYTEYTPVTDLGKKLNSVFEKYNLFKDGFMCTNAFEPALCEFLTKENVEILLKSRVVNFKKLNDGTFEILVISTEGLSTFYAKDVIDTRPSKNAQKYLTVISMTENIDPAVKILSEVFENSTFEKAFYCDRFAMYLPAGTSDINEMLNNIHDLWLTAKVDAKILYVAPVFATKADKNNVLFPKDYNFSNPIEAFEAGVLFQGGAK